MTLGFGTDGIRGIAGTELTAELALRLGRAVAQIFPAPDGRRPLFLIGKDPRLSGDFLEAALAAGLAGSGWDVLSLGVAPTPALSFLVRQMEAAGAAVISASHNPPEYNGIKLFAADGGKLPQATEQAVESRMADLHAAGGPGQSGAGPAIPGSVWRDHTWQDKYISFLMERLGSAAAGRHVVLDCGHGALGELAPKLFRAAGARVTVLHHEPDGTRINVACGATHPETAAAVVREQAAQAGFSFDGDGDRCLAVDETGSILDGDKILAVTGLGRLQRQALPQKALAATVMSNLGLDQALAAHGGQVIRTAVGDRQVAEAMAQHGLALGGEQSGHIIFADAGQPTGDGLLTAVELMREMHRTGAPLSQLAAAMVPLPQVQRNVTVGDQRQIVTTAAVTAAVAQAEESLAGQGRVLVRPSGTEPVVRVMAEGPQETQLETIVDDIAAVLTEEDRRLAASE